MLFLFRSWYPSNSVLPTSWMHDLSWYPFCRCMIEHKCSSLALLKTRVCGQLRSALLKDGQTGVLICQIRDVTQILYTFWYQRPTFRCHCFVCIWYTSANNLGWIYCLFYSCYAIVKSYCGDKLLHGKHKQLPLIILDPILVMWLRIYANDY